MKDPKYIVIDLFCGAGGTSTGFSRAKLDGNMIAYVAACVNHDAVAIESHWANHPDVYHFNEDITTLYGVNRNGTLFMTPEFMRLRRLVDIYRAMYPDAKVILWASLECTNFSNAKGGQARDADSRTLAEHLHYYIHGLNPDYVQIENVVEFMAWGPLGKNGKPISRDKGKDWMRWRRAINKHHGMTDIWNTMNSANYGSFTSRNRLFGCFAKGDLPIIWPRPTHAKKPTGELKPWKAVREKLDFEDKGLSIFNRKKPLVDATLERIFAGLIKFVAKGDKSFIMKYYSGKPQGKVISVDGPAGTIKTSDSQALVQTSFIVQRNGGDPDSRLIDIEGPARTITQTGGNQDLVQSEFLSAYHGKGDNVSSVEVPSPTIPTKDSLAFIQPEYFIDVHFGYTQNQSVDVPLGTVLPNDKHRLIEVDPFIMPTNYNNQPRSIDEPHPTITADGHYAYLVNPSHGGHTMGVDQPCPVIIARQDKAPLYLIQIEKGNAKIPVYAGESEAMVKIKHFMAHYGLKDIKMRMLKISELKIIQGFPADYILKGSQKDQKKHIGNSVEPIVVERWSQAMAEHEEKVA